MKLEKCMEKYGREMTVHTSDGWVSNTFHAFIEPLRYKNKMYLDGINTEIGYDKQGHYLYIGPAEHDLSQLDDDSFVQADSDKFIVDRAEKVYKGKDVLYIWAIIREIVEVDENE